MRRLIHYLLILLVFVVPLIFSKATTEVYGLVKIVTIESFALSILLASLIRQIKTPPSPLRISIIECLAAFFFILAGISLAKAVNVYAGLGFIYLLAAYLVLLSAILRNTEGVCGVRKLVISAITSGVFACGWVIYENRILSLSASRFVYGSTFGNPIFFSQYLSAMVPLSLSMAIQVIQKSPRKNIAYFLKIAIYLLAAAVMLFLIIVVRSRGAYLGLAAALAYLCFIMLRPCSGRVRKAILSASAVLIALTIVLAATLWPKLQANIETRQLRNLMRVHVWASSLKMIKEHPVLGVGAGNFKYAYPLYRTEKEKEVTPKGIRYSRAHNQFLQVWAQMGILALMVFAGILITAFKKSAFLIREKRRQDKPAEATLVAGLAAALIALVIQSLFNPMLEVPTSGLLFWLLLGMLFAVARQGGSVQLSDSPPDRALAKRRGVIAGGLCAVLIAAAPVNIFKPLVGDYFLEKAQVADSEHDTERALSDFKRSVRVYPHNWEALFLLGKIYQRTGLYKEAINYYEKAAQYHPNYAIIWNNLGAAYMKNNDIENAVSAFERAVTIDDLYVGARYNLALAYQGNDQFDLANGQIKELSSVNPTFLGNMYLESGIFDEAALEFHKVLRRDPDNVEAHFKLGQIWEKRNEIDKAIQVYKATVELQPSHVMAHILLGDLYKDKKQEADKAIFYYEKALEAIPVELDKIYRDILFYGDLGIYAQALARYKDIDELKDIQVDLRMKLASIYKSKGQTRRAMEEYEKLSGMTTNADIWENLAVIYEKEGMYEKAKDAYSGIVEFDPDREKEFKEDLLRLNRIASHHALARIYEGQDMYEKAAAEYRAVLGFKPRDLYTWRQLGKVHTEIGDLAEAEGAYRRIIEIDPNDIETRLVLGDLFYQSGEMKTAEEEYVQMIGLAPYDSRGFLSLGRLYRRQKRLDEAEELYEKGIRFSPGDAHLHLAMATLMEEKGRIDAAVSEYRKVLAIEADNKEARTRLNALQQ